MSEIQSQKQTKMRRGLPVYPTNPYSREIQLSQRKTINHDYNKTVIDRKTGEVYQDGALFTETEFVDHEAFIKVYASGWQSLTGISKTATTMLIIIASQMWKNKGTDRVFIPFQELEAAEIKISRSTYSAGIAELLRAKFIAQSPTQGSYWINPTYIFNGDRIGFLKEYRRKMTDQEKLELLGQQRLTLA